MTALSAIRATRSRNLGIKRRVPLDTAAVIYAGALVMLDADGYARAAVALASNQGVCGVAVESKTSTGADGTSFVIVQEGEFRFAGVSLAQTDVGLLTYASDDQTFSSSQAGNEPKVGILMEVESSTVGWVKVGAPEALL